MIKIKNKFLLILFLSLVHTYSWETSSAQSLVDQSIEELYNYDLNKSLSTLDSAFGLDSAHPLIPFLQTSVLWLKIQMTEGYESSYKQIEESLIEYIPYYKRMIKQNSENIEYKLYLGALFGLESRIALAKNQWFKVFISSIKGYRYINEVYKNDPYLLDALMPIGIISFYTCNSNVFIKSSAKIFGINTDCEFGLDLLEKASTESYYSWVESSNVLSHIYLYLLKDFESSLQKSTLLVEKFPNHPFFIFLKAESLLKLKRYDEFIKIRPKLVELENFNSKIIKDECALKLQYLDALYMFSQNNYNDTIKNCTKIIQGYNMEFDWLLILTRMLRAESYLKIEDMEKAKKDFKIISKMDSKYPEIQEASIYLKSLSHKK